MTNTQIKKGDCIHWKKSRQTGCMIGRRLCMATRTNNQCTDFEQRGKLK